MRTEQRSFRGDDPDDVKQLLQQTTASTEAPDVEDILNALDEAVDDLQKEEEPEGIIYKKFIAMNNIDNVDKILITITNALPQELETEIKAKEAEGYVYSCRCGTERYLCPKGKWVKK